MAAAAEPSRSAASTGPVGPVFFSLPSMNAVAGASHDVDTHA